MERLEYLGINDLIIYQDDDLYHFTSDAILLSKFTRTKKGDVVADFCAGSGIVGLYLYALNPSIKSVTFFEMQEKLFNLSKKSIQKNNLENQLFAYNLKLQDIDSTHFAKYSLITCNPPYEKLSAGDIQENMEIAVCRKEITITLEEIITACRQCLKFGGRLSMVHRADRLCDIIFEMKKNNIEPKRLQFVSSGKNKEPYLVLIEGVLGGKSGLKVLSNIEN